jgi:methylenetetrahydrofolate dehydrogenase (NADP+)/methenyltetrahydrofolate cyclohydrolase
MVAQILLVSIAEQGMGEPETWEGVAVGRLWDGGDVAQELLEKVRQEVTRLREERQPPPMLAEIRVGEWPAAAHLHVLQAEACRITGIFHQVHTFPRPCDTQRIRHRLAELNADPSITGIAIHIRPPARLGELAAALAPGKDVDGVLPLHLGRFLTNKRVGRRPRGADIVQLLKRAVKSLEGMHVICVGNASGCAGLLAWHCLHENATVSAWSTPTAWPLDMLPDADVLILDTNDLPVMDRVALKPGGTWWGRSNDARQTVSLASGHAPLTRQRVARLLGARHGAGGFPIR